jgi:hypothetical protein
VSFSLRLDDLPAGAISAKQYFRALGLYQQWSPDTLWNHMSVVITPSKTRQVFTLRGGIRLKHTWRISVWVYTAPTSGDPLTEAAALSQQPCLIFDHQGEALDRWVIFEKAWHIARYRHTVDAYECGHAVATC